MYVAGLPSEKAHANLGMLNCSLSTAATCHAGANLTSYTLKYSQPAWLCSCWHCIACCLVVYVDGLLSSTKILFLSRLAVCTSTADSWSAGFSMALRPPAEAVFSWIKPLDVCCIHSLRGVKYMLAVSKSKHLRCQLPRYCQNSIP